MLKRDILSWWFRPPFLRSWGTKSSTLFAGPWLGEFGWELLNWQAFLRWLAPSYDKVIVSCRAGTEALYADFAHEFRHHAVKGTSETNTMLKVDTPDELARALSEIPPGADHLPHVGWQPDARKVFVPYGTPDPARSTDVLFHPRGRGFGTDRNWDTDKWSALLAGLAEAGVSVGCIGLSHATLDIPGDWPDYRDIPLRESMDVIASAKLVVGPSSGPMHLASLCRTPHLVWTDTKGYARGRTNRTKYERWWNPFDTPAYVVDHEGFDPRPETILEATLAAVKRSP